jgi:hypothetical protein
MKTATTLTPVYILLLGLVGCLSDVNHLTVNKVLTDSPKGLWGRVTPIADNNHPNLFYNQREVDELRRMVLVQRNPMDLANLYDSSIKDVHAIFTQNTCTWETITNMKAALSYMIEPADSKASAIRAYLLALQKFRPRGLPDWYTECFRAYPSAWMFDLVQAYHPHLFSEAEKAGLKNWFALSSAKLKFNARDEEKIGASPPRLIEGKLMQGFPNWYSRFMAPALAAALVSGDQSLVDYWADSGWPHNLFIFDGINSNGHYPSDSANRYDLVMYLLAVYPSGANTDTYNREGYNRSTGTWYTVDYAWGVYHFAQIGPALLAAEMAYHNGMSRVFEITDVSGTEPAVLRSYKRAIESKNEIDTQPANTFGHPVIGWANNIFMAHRRYNDPVIENAAAELLNNNVPSPPHNGGIITTHIPNDHIPWEVMRFFAYPRQIVWPDGGAVSPRTQAGR